MNRKLALRPWCVLLCAAGLLSVSWARTTTATGGATGAVRAAVSDEDAIAKLVDELVTAIGPHGLVRFPDMAYPFLMLLGGGDPPFVAIDSQDELGVFDTESADLVLSGCATRVMDRVALSEFVFGPADQPNARATGYAILCKPLDFWVVQGVALAPALDPGTDEGKAWALAEPKQRDAVSALAVAFGRSLTNTGFQKFEGIGDIFIAFDGATGQFRPFRTEDDYPVPGDPIARSTTRIQSKVLPGLARASVTVIADEGLAEFQLLCLGSQDGWKVAIAIITPPEAQPTEDTTKPADDAKPAEGPR
jgi:hypothetical protein